MGMAVPDTVMFPEEFEKLQHMVRGLLQDANAKVVFLVDKNGQQIASAGQLENLDTTSLASLTAGNVAATEGLAQLIGESRFCTLFHEGQQDSLHITLISNKVILLVIFDEHSSLGLVRLRVGEYGPQLKSVVDEILERGDDAQETAAVEMSLDDLSDEDIEALFA